MADSRAEISLKGRVALVTGASRGIGRGVAQELAERGALVYVTGRTLEEGGAALPGSLPGTVEEIRAAGGEAIAVVCDHRDDAAVERLFEQIRGEQGRLDLLVNNAFLLPEDLDPKLPFWQTPLSNWDDMIDVGTRSAYVASVFAAGMMVEQRDGLIVHISSFGGRHYHLHVAYGVGKQGLDRIAKDGGRQLAPHGVSMVSLWPYFVKTERLLLAPMGDGVDLEGAESIRFAGIGIASLAADPDRQRFNGRAVTTHQLAREYGFRDIDGSMPGASMEPQ
ncbi:MAG: SDR family NAD(P)-dependent oxidoreductase [Myxococcales bacterium]|nr:SDR family NAD(P)-dependent oxidoreductase [Myxococcales bacterium]